MAKDKPLTVSNLVAALKKAGVPTTNTLRQVVREELAAYGVATKDDLGKLERSLKLRMGKHKRELSSGIAKVALTSPTLSKFDKLKEKVDRHHTN